MTRFLFAVAVLLASGVAEAQTPAPAAPPQAAPAAAGAEDQLPTPPADFSYTAGGRRDPFMTLTSPKQPLPIMTDLYEATRLRIHLAVLSGIDVVYVEIVGGAGMAVGSRTGGRLPAHATGVGKAMLAYSPAAVVRTRLEAGLPRLTPRTITSPGAFESELRKIRSVGMAMDLEESTVGLSCVAAPVFDSDRKVHAALSITGRTATFDPGLLGPAVRTAAFTLSRTLRTSGL